MAREKYGTVLIFKKIFAEFFRTFLWRLERLYAGLNPNVFLSNTKTCEKIFILDSAVTKSFVKSGTEWHSVT